MPTLEEYDYYFEQCERSNHVPLTYQQWVVEEAMREKHRLETQPPQQPGGMLLSGGNIKQLAEKE